MSSFHGRFVWYELMTTDVPAAEAFYRQVIGWNTSRPGVGSPDYVVFQAGETGVAGLAPAPADALAMGARPAWVGYVCVDDVDASADQLLKAGGKVHRAPADIPGVGRFAVVADPQDAMFMLFTPDARMATDPPPAPAPDTPGTFSWRELFSSDREGAFAFYSGLFGWTKDKAYDMGAMGPYQTVDDSTGVAVIGMMTRPPHVPVSYWHYYMQVDSVGAAIDRIKAAGGQVLMGPQQVPTGTWVAAAIDPQGAYFGVNGPNP